MATQREIDRRKMLAQALMNQQRPQGSMAGRFYVRPSAASNVVSGLANIGGIYQANKADKEQLQLEEDQKAQLAKAIREMTGAPPPVMDQSGMTGPSSAPANPQREAALSVLRGLPLDQQQAIIGQQAVGRLFPKNPDPYTLTPGAVRFGGDNKQVAQAPSKSATETPFERQLESAGFVKGTPEYQSELKKFIEKQTTHAPAPATNVTLNTEKNLYGTMADKQGAENVSLFQQAQKAPELLGRAQRVKQVLSEGDAITGAGANWLLGAAKAANQLGFNTGDAAADTEALGRDLAAATLDQIKSSGLGAGSGFSNADRDFLEKVVGGTITLESSTLRRLAELNEKSALATIDRWNATASRLDSAQLKNLGMSQIAMPAGSASPSAAPKLQKNPDGTYTYTP